MYKYNDVYNKNKLILITELWTFSLSMGVLPHLTLPGDVSAGDIHTVN